MADDDAAAWVKAARSCAATTKDPFTKRRKVLEGLPLTQELFDQRRALSSGETWCPLAVGNHVVESRTHWQTCWMLIYSPGGHRPHPEEETASASSILSMTSGAFARPHPTASVVWLLFLIPGPAGHVEAAVIDMHLARAIGNFSAVWRVPAAVRVRTLSNSSILGFSWGSYGRQLWRSWYPWRYYACRRRGGVCARQKSSEYISRLRCASSTGWDARPRPKRGHCTPSRDIYPRRVFADDVVCHAGISGWVLVWLSWLTSLDPVLRMILVSGNDFLLDVAAAGSTSPVPFHICTTHW